jgi:hypothetical protein
VLLDEEIKNGEQERENLRIEAQRLRDELSDLKVEAEITQEKLRIAEENWASRKELVGAGLSVRPPSPGSDAASMSGTTISSPTVATPPPKGENSSVQLSPPSPPLSETSTAVAVKAPPPITPANKRILEPGTTPRPLHSGIRAPRHSRGPSIPTVRQTGPASAAPKRTTTRPSIGGGGRQSLSGLPQPTPSATRDSNSLNTIRGLRRKMATLEECVHRAHSKLPAPTTTPPRASPRSVLDTLPAGITVRSSRKRPSTTSASADGPASRLSFGFNPSASVSGSAGGGGGGGGGGGESRPSSRASLSSGVPRPSSRASGIARPPSQSSMRTPSSLGYYPQSERRPRSSMSGSYAGPNPTTQATPSRAGTPAGSRHGYSSSIAGDTSLLEEDDADGGVTPTARRSSAIPQPGLGRRQSMGLVRRQSGIGGDGGGGGEMLPPARKERKTGVDIGETF